MNPFEVPADELIKAIAADLKENFKVEQPAFAMFVKTACSRDRVPQQKDWYYTRLASLLYRVFKEGTVGVGSLRTYYGGRKNRGRRKHKFKRAGGKIIRFGLQQLEQLGFIQKGKKGRMLTKQGQAYLSKKAAEVKKKLEEKEKLMQEEAKKPEKVKETKEPKETAEAKASKKPKAVEKKVQEAKQENTELYELKVPEKKAKEAKSAEVIAELKKKLASEHSAMPENIKKEGIEKKAEAAKSHQKESNKD